MEFRTPHLLLPQERGPVKAHGSLGEDPNGIPPSDDTDVALRLEAGAGDGNVTMMPLLLPHSLETLLATSAHGLGMTKAGVRKAGVIGMTAMSVAREKGITIIVGEMLLAHRRISHGHHRHSTLLP